MARALAFTDQIVNEAGVVLTRGMRGELPGSDAREMRLCAQAIRAERVPSASSMPTVAPRVIVHIAPYAQVQPRGSGPIAHGLWTKQVTDGETPPSER